VFFLLIFDKSYDMIVLVVNFFVCCTTTFALTYFFGFSTVHALKKTPDKQPEVVPLGGVFLLK